MHEQCSRYIVLKRTDELVEKVSRSRVTLASNSYEGPRNNNETIHIHIKDIIRSYLPGADQTHLQQFIYYPTPSQEEEVENQARQPADPSPPKDNVNQELLITMEDAPAQQPKTDTDYDDTT